MAAVGAAVGAFFVENAAIISAVSAASSVAKTTMSVVSQMQSANAEAEYQDKQNLLIRKSAAESYGDLSPAEIDIQRQAADQAIQQQAEAAKAKGRVNLFAAASGTYGQSVDTMLFETDAIQQRNINQILKEREAGLFNIRQQGEQIRQGAINSQSTAAISKPSWLEAGAAIGTSALESYDRYNTKKPTFDKQKKVTGGV